ncbi:efflux RND transporter periplasmic adaptor subunit [Aureitalea sp. L0-47]|uniref:efflux RND transporter periplasmic adaptor subunit n=1 Tax=Aureitalea sp. L0-47 TaxID=2816962 RepID=UPI002238E368|nr:efflux RND transporter periplasmic adaptor subunit [Aureitalea sp. L0-47]MCW5518953.1 efflux RND transporter periplasmic adaptor subunit [Aureitalea sp. L0-47]
MKKFAFILTLAFLLSACGGDGNKQSVEALIEEGNLENMLARKVELRATQTEIQNELSELEAAIKKLDTTDNAALVTTMKLKDTLFQHFIEIQGNVETNQNVIIYPEYQGVLTRVLVKKGDRVRKGQVLARIDDGGLGSQLSQLKVQEELARTTFDRQERLWQQKIGSEIQYLQAKANYEATSNSVKQLESQLGKTTVRAPFSGVIDDVITDQGTVVSPGQALFRIVNLNDMYIQAEVPERYIKSVIPGKEVAISLPMLGEEIKSEIRQTGNYINPNNRAFTVEVDVPNSNGNIKPNLTARLRINDYTNEEAILIPLSVISENAEGEQYVYLAVESNSGNGNSRARQQTISTGKAQGDYIEVLSGLTSGQSIIIEGARSIKNEQEVKIINQ